jgi:hypothetical protein
MCIPAVSWKRVSAEMGNKPFRSIKEAILNTNTVIL